MKLINLIKLPLYGRELVWEVVSLIPLTQMWFSKFLANINCKRKCV